MSTLHTLSLAEMAAGLKAKQFSSRELTQHYLARIAAHDKALNSFVTVTPEIALAQADAADARLAQGNASTLTGIPLDEKALAALAKAPVSGGLCRSWSTRPIAPKAAAERRTAPTFCGSVT